MNKVLASLLAATFAAVSFTALAQGTAGSAAPAAPQSADAKKAASDKAAADKAAASAAKKEKRAKKKAANKAHREKTKDTSKPQVAKAVPKLRMQGLPSLHFFRPQYLKAPWRCLPERSSAVDLSTQSVDNPREERAPERICRPFTVQRSK
jgi:hypothetical protein